MPCHSTAQHSTPTPPSPCSPCLPQMSVMWSTSPPKAFLLSPPLPDPATAADERDVQRKLLDLVRGDRTKLPGCFQVDQLIFQEMMYTRS